MDLRDLARAVRRRWWLVVLALVAGPVNPVPVAPRPVVNLSVGLGIGVLVGAAAAVGRELLDVSVKSADTLRDTAGALAVVTYAAAARRTPLILARSISSTSRWRGVGVERRLTAKTSRPNCRRGDGAAPAL